MFVNEFIKIFIIMFCVCATRYKTTPSSITIYIIVVISTRGLKSDLEMPVPSQGHYGFHSFPVVD